MPTFTITDIHKRGFKAKIVSANDAASAMSAYAQQNCERVILPLRTESPVHIVTHNGEADYLASRWSGQIAGRRVYIHD